MQNRDPIWGITLVEVVRGLGCNFRGLGREFWGLRVLALKKLEVLGLAHTSLASSTLPLWVVLVEMLPSLQTLT